jgi:hypothetical protein
VLAQQQLSISTEIAQAHYDEWLASAIDPEIINLNLRSLWGTTPYDYLLSSPKISRRNDGRLRDGDLRKYRHIEHGGWWCSGVDPLNNYLPMDWGCFKPDQPRRDKQKIHKFIKYEHPYKEVTRAFFPYVSDEFWAKTSNRCGIPITEEDRLDPRGFWYWVWRNNVPVIIVEGVKKASALVSAGYAAIAIPGVNNGYRTPKDEYGNAIGQPYLIPEIQHFATLGRQVNICFDNDSKPETRQDVRAAINRMGRLLITAGCEVRVINLPPGAEKGVDDFIAAKGQDAFHALFNTAEVLEMWQLRLSTLLTYPPAIALSQRFLGQILIPENEKLIILKAPKNTGKTEWLTQEVTKAHDKGQRVLVITHRIQLGEALCNRFGVNYVTEMHDSETGDLLGYGVCVDSLRAESQAKFNPNDWSNHLVIIDEADQVFWHLLNSDTEVAKRRVAILKNLKQLVQNVLSSPQGRIYLSSADISDIDVNYILSLAGGIHVKPFVIVNDYQLQSGNCYNYQGNDPRKIIAALDKAIAKGGHHLVCCSAQKTKSKYGTQALERRYRKKFPHLRILRIDSQTVADPNHPAYGCMGHLDQILTEYDLVICSPSLETGISIDIKSHFSAVWGIFQGVQPVSSVRQMLARLRETVDRHIWVRKRGLGKIGNGSTSVGALLHSQHKVTKANIILLSAADNADYSYIDEKFQPESLQTWAKRACVINAQMKCYRDAVLQGLADDGYTILDAEDIESVATEQVFHELKTAVHELQTTEYQEVASSGTLTTEELEQIKEKRAKTKSERQQERKAELTQRYGVEVTPELVRKDDAGWYPQLRLHYYLTLGRQFLVARDAKRAKKQAEAGNNAIWKPDFNRGQLLPVVMLLEKLNIPQLLNPEVEWRSSSPQLQEMRRLAVEYKQVIRDFLGVSVSEKDSAIAICQKFLKKLGLKLSYLGRFGSRGQRERVYKFVPPQDERGTIFQAWLHRDEASSASTKENVVDAANVSTPNNI